MSGTDKRMVWKHELPLGEGSFELQLPRRCTILTVGVTDGIPVLWEQHWPGESNEPVRFHARDTGQELEVSDYVQLVYVGTIVEWLTNLKMTYVRHVWMEKRL